jgi:hypothetical protein
MLVKARKNSKHELECSGPHEITQKSMTTARFASRNELSMMLLTSLPRMRANSKSHDWSKMQQMLNQPSP